MNSSRKPLQFQRVGVGLVLLTSSLLVGCRQDMHNQAKYEPYEASDFFANNAGARVPPAHTVGRNSVDLRSSLYTGEVDGAWMEAVPFLVDEAFLRRGQERFDIYCSPCHDTSGAGRGMIVQRGFKQPPSYHEQRLREMPLGYFYSVATNGYGLMSGYKGQVKLQDRWAIAAWVRVLQRSQHVPVESLAQADREHLAGAEIESAATSHSGGAL